MTEKLTKPVTLSWSEWVNQVKMEPVVVDGVCVRVKAVFPELQVKDMIEIPNPKFEAMIRRHEGLADDLPLMPEATLALTVGEDSGARSNFWRTKITMPFLTAQKFYIYLNDLRSDGCTKLDPDQAG